MSNESKKKSKATTSLSDVEVEPGAWERFEQAVDAALHTPPQHRPKNDHATNDRDDELA